MAARKTWFVTYRGWRSEVYGFARMSETFDSAAEAKVFVRALPAQSDITAGTINPHVPKKFYGSTQIAEWLADDAEPAAPNRTRTD